MRGQRSASSRVTWPILLAAVGIAAIGIAAIGIAGWLDRERLLEHAAELWIVSDAPTRADAIVVLGGNSRTRPVIAADLYRRGLANKVLVSATTHGSQPAYGGSLPDAVLNRAALVKSGVPADAIETFGVANASTRDEAAALRKWIDRNGRALIFIIPSEAFTARRVRWIFHRELSALGVTVEVPSFNPPDYPREQWWKTEQGQFAFRTEILKYVYYRLAYCC